MNITVISDLKFLNGKIGIENEDGEFEEIHSRQGGYDAACVVYSLMMNLHIIGFVSRAMLDAEDLDKRNPRNRFVSHFFNDFGFVKKGFYFAKMRKEIESYTNELEVLDDSLCATAKERVDMVEHYIDENMPVIVSVYPKGAEYAHAMLAVGIEYDGMKVKKILCLDPDCDMPTIAPWNAYIDTSNLRSKYSCTYVNLNTSPESDPLKVSFEEFMVIDYK